MANGFAALMPFLQATGLPDLIGEDINVLRKRDAVPQAQAPTLSAPPIEQDVGPISLGNRSFIEERDDAYSKQPQRKGLFGIKGTLRDVLGALGDNYLIRSGAKPQYAPRREQERLSDAMAGFTQQDPRAAIERAAGINPEFARDLFQLVGQQQAKAQDQQIDAYQAQGTAQKDGQTAFKEGSRLFGQYAGAIARNPQLAPKLLPVLQKIREQYRLPMDAFGIPGEDDTELYEGFQYGGTPTQTQIADTRKVEAAAAKESQFTRAEAGRMARDNPPVERQPTRQEQAEGLYRRAIGGDKEAQALFDRLYPEPKRSRTRTRTPSAGVPAVGTKKGGYTFKGGNPADPKNWKKD